MPTPVRRLLVLVVLVALACVARPAGAQRPAAGPPAMAPDVAQYVSVRDSTVALVHARVIDGTGAPPREDQTIVLGGGVIRALGPSASVAVPAGARVIDLTGRSVLPGLVMLHEHMFYPAGGGVYNEQALSFPKLYLAGGVTTARTAGNMAGYADLEMKKAIAAGRAVGPDLDVTAPYLEGGGPSFTYQLHQLADAADARQIVAHFADRGATSFKAYMHITRAELGAAVAEAHRRKLKVTGHLCSVTYREALALGIDDFEHGLPAVSDFVKAKVPDECPTANGGVMASLVDLDMDGAPVRALIHDMIAKGAALTSTLTIFETFTPGRPPAPDGALDALLPEARRQYTETKARIDASSTSAYRTVFPKEMRFERDFFRAGGLLLAGTDPTGYGGVVAGYANARELELLVEAGLTPLEAIEVATMNGARYLGRAGRIGSVAVGKRADLMVVRGDPSANIAAVRDVETVFKDGVGYDSAKLFASVKGMVGLH